MNDYKDAVRAAFKKAQEEKVSAVLNAKPTLVETMETREFTIEPIAIDGVQYRRVKVEQTRFAGGADDYVTVRAYGQDLTKTGSLNKRSTPFWHTMPDELAEPLLRHARRQEQAG